MGDLGKKIRDLRRSRGLSQRELADKLGISHTRLGDFERGLTHATQRPAVPGRPLLEKLAEVFGYPLDNLLALGGYPMATPATLPKPTATEIEAQELLALYRQLPRRQQRLLMRLAEAIRQELDDEG